MINDLKPNTQYEFTIKVVKVSYHCIQYCVYIRLLLIETKQKQNAHNTKY